ncbi:PEPxxWA-CTERM sorting domain-containing protein [uncultured Rhodoblastus sp.]|uniref:PEPxxWA-CTERM sorting domain-containing protein n=1 Tax=uncultured Rhodoblastus sp. TaxID=543037 RepID=UPI0025CBCF73|nr:PEPxxWA-CTERM sorting domain-containing protein [uncultured Rhodoblastus sp.]
MKTSAQNLSALALTLALGCGAAAQANATVALSFYQSGTTTDVDYENFLNSTFGAGLTPTERFVGQVSGNNSNGLFVPTTASGFPAPDGTGVTSALTNHPPVGNGTNGGGSVVGSFATYTAWTNGGGQVVPFSLSRSGQTVTYTLAYPGGATATWTSATADYFGQATSFELRARSVAPSGHLLSDGFTIDNLKFTDTSVTNQNVDSLLSAHGSQVYAANGDTTIALFTGVAPGDFTLTGDYVLQWTNNDNITNPGRTWNSQVKALDLPTAAPEPSTWAMMMIGFAVLGFAAQRKKRQARADV